MRIAVDRLSLFCLVAAVFAHGGNGRNARESSSISLHIDCSLLITTLYSLLFLITTDFGRGV